MIMSLMNIFIKGKLDSYPADNPVLWHVKGNGDLFQKGYIHKIWFYTDKRRLTWGFWLNTDKQIFNRYQSSICFCAFDQFRYSK